MVKMEFNCRAQFSTLSSNNNSFFFSTAGFSVGDELGFGESLGNLESNKRRSLSHGDQLIAANSVGTIPASNLPVSTYTVPHSTV